MKKLIAISVVFALIAGAAFAQTANGISVNGWGRGVFAPLVNVGAEKADGKVLPDEEGNDLKSSNYAGAGVTWGGPQVRTDFRINGDAEFLGFQIQLGEGNRDNWGSNVNTVDIMDNAYIWAKPFSNDILKLYVGKFDVDNLRGKLGTDTGFENFVLNPMDEDKIFNRFRAGDGFMLSSAPVDGLFIGLRVNGALWNWGGPTSGTKLLDAYRFLQFGLGYDIADIGHIRAQWVGGWFGDIGGDKLKELGNKFDKGPGDGTARIEAAFALTAVQNLLIDLGFKFWLPLSDEDAKATNGVEVGLGARFRADAFQIVGQIHSNFASYDRIGSDDKQANGLNLAVNLIPTYDLDAFTLGASIGLKVGGASTVGLADVANGSTAKNGDKNKDNSMQVGFGAFAQKGLGSGSVKAGLAYTVAPSYGGKASGSNVFSIPIILEYAFF
jgi:hypothetical protein